MTGNSASIALHGEWCLEKAGEIRTQLAEAVSGLQQAERRPDAVELQMAQVSGIDACGCQMLAVLLENLRRAGITPLPSGISSEVGASIETLGFSVFL